MISNNEFDDWGQPASATQRDPDGNNAGVDLMQVAMRRKGLIALGIFLGLCLGLLYYARATEMFESSAQLLIREESSPWEGMGKEQMSLGVGFSKADDHAIGIASQRIIRDTLTALEESGDLDNLPSLTASENPQKTILQGLEVSPLQEGSEVLQLIYKGTHAEDCSVILDEIMQTYTDFLNKKREDQGKIAVDTLTTVKDELQVERDKLTAEYETWKKDNSGLFQQNDQGIILEQVQLAKLEDEIFATQGRIGSLTNEIAILKQAKEDGVDPEALLLLAQQAGNARGWNLNEDDLESRLRRLTERFEQQEEGALLQEVSLAMRYGPDHPKRKALQRQLELSRKIYEEKIAALGQIDQEQVDGVDLASDALNDYIVSLQVTIKREEQDLQRLREERELVHGRAKSLLADAAKDRWYREEIARQNLAFNQAVEKLSNIDMSETYGSDERFRIERFSEPGLGIKTDPSLAKSLAGGTMLGFLAGFGLGYLVEMFDKTFRSPQEVSDLLQLPMIGHIPEIIPEAVEGSALSETLITAHKPKSPLAENFRAIRTALYFSTSGQQHRVLQTTSPVPGDGKSTLTANLAITIAQSNKSILVVDADFRRPTQHKLFGLQNTTGLSSVVIGEADPLEAAQPTEIPNLHVMPCGPRPHNPSELLTSPQFEELLEVLREQYDFVMIDTPPVLAVTDPGIVSARVDGVIMALRIRKNGRPGTVRARKILKDLDANILGIVVNGIDHRSGAYGYYSNYRRGYGYGNYGGYGKSQEAAEKMIDKYYEEPAEEKVEARG